MIKKLAVDWLGDQKCSLLIGWLILKFAVDWLVAYRHSVVLWWLLQHVLHFLVNNLLSGEGWTRRNHLTRWGRARGSFLLRFCREMFAVSSRDRWVKRFIYFLFSLWRRRRNTTKIRYSSVWSPRFWVNKMAKSGYFPLLVLTGAGGVDPFPHERDACEFYDLINATYGEFTCVSMSVCMEGGRLGRVGLRGGGEGHSPRLRAAMSGGGGGGKSSSSGAALFTTITRTLPTLSWTWKQTNRMEEKEWSNKRRTFYKSRNRSRSFPSRDAILMGQKSFPGHPEPHQVAWRQIAAWRASIWPGHDFW